MLINDDFVNCINDLPYIDLILTDIPYQVSRENNFKTMKDRQGRNGIDFGEWDYNFDISSLKKLIPKLKKGGSFIIFSSFEQYNDLIYNLSELELKDRIIFRKTNPMPRNRDRRYISNIELITWFVKKGDKWIFNRQSEKYDESVISYPAESGGGFKKYHPTQKPLRLIEELIKRHSNPGDIVLDCCAGSGTTGLACKNLNRKYILIEKSKDYYNTIINRL